MIGARRLLLLGCCWLLLGVELAWAGWLTIQNQTNQTVIIQETYVIAGKPRRGRPIQLLAGETVREFFPSPTIKTVELYDVKNPQRPLWSGQIPCRNNTQTYIITTANNGQIIVQAAPSSK
jgi:hypothetical protein